MFYTLLIIVHVLASVLMILVVLMQSSKGEGLSGAFGMGSGSSALFGADTANILTKATVVFATIFALTSLGIALIQTHRGKSIAMLPDQGAGFSDISDTATLSDTETAIDTASEAAPDTAVE